MKHIAKTMLTVLLAAALMLSMLACTEDKAAENTATPAPTVSEAAAPSPSESEEPTASPSEEAEPSEEEGFTYTSELYGFTVTMPESWRDTVEIVEEDAQVSFCSKANRHLNYGDVEYDAGVLFTVLVPEDDMKDGDGYVFPNYEVIGQINGADLLVVYPTDVQFNTDDQAAQEEYRTMEQDVADVVSGISFG